MTFANFMVIQYALLIQRIPALQPVFSSMWVFAAIFISAYVPLAIVIGYWHRKTQWKVEQEAMFNENVVQARLWLFMINLIEGKATEKERKEMRELLEKIMTKMPRDQSSGKSDTEAV
jgi:hypothetical protein